MISAVHIKRCADGGELSKGLAIALSGAAAHGLQLRGDKAHEGESGRVS